MSLQSQFYELPVINRVLMVVGLTGTLIGVVGVLIAHNIFWIQFFDNLHWTFAYALGAILAWQGAYLARQRGESEKPWWWFCFGLIAYTLAQIIWAIQVYVGWTPFPGPSDPFFLMLGPAFLMGIYTYGRSLFTWAKWRIVLLDTSLLFIAMLIATMMFYVPQQGNYSSFQLCVMVAYPAGLWAAASLGLIMMLEMRARFNLREVLLFSALMGNIMLWNQWNLRIFADDLIDGSLLNILFSPFAILLGLGAAIWRPVQAKPDKHWDRVCENLLRMLPLFMVIFSAVGIVLSVTFSGVSNEIRIIAVAGSLVVVILATIRQSLTLKDRDQLLASQEESHRGRALLQTIINTAPIRVFWKDRNSRFLGCNNNFAEDAGMIKPEDLIGKDDFQMVWAKEATSYQANDNAVMLSGQSRLGFEELQTTLDGGTRWLRTSKVPLRDSVGSVIGMIGLYEDISDHKRNEEVLRALAERGSAEGEELFKTIVRQLALSHNIRYAFIGRINPDTKTTIDTLAVWAGDDYGANFSYPLEGTPCQKVVQDNVCFYPDNIQELFPQNKLLVDQKVKSFQGVALKDKLQNVLGVLALLDDKPMIEKPHTSSLLNSLAVRASIELERRASDERQELSARIFNETHEGILITNADGTIIDVNPTFCEITGYSREEAIGQNPRILNSGRQSPDFYTEMWQSIIAQGHWQGELWNRKKNGDLFAEMLSISALKDEYGHTSNYISLFSDITESKKQKEQLELMAHYDVLTHLPNRVLFADRFIQAIAHSKRTETLLVVCFLDLDYFKLVNDTYGHDVGDKLLIEVAKRIKASIREEDTVSRQGGDEFAVLLGDIESLEHCQKMLDRLHFSLAQPYLIDEKLLNISASSGVTLYPLDNADLDTLLRHADQAMYQAKLAGRNDFNLFNADEDQQLIVKHHQLEEIQHALKNGEFRLYYQPKVNMTTGEVFGAEALIRWSHPVKGLIPPLDFLPLIDGTTLEIKIGDWVISEALKQIKLWQQQGLSLEISVNIASYHLQSPSFITQLEAALALHPDIKSKSLQLEILESSALSDLTAISTIIKTCQNDLGVNIALDDFGTGYSSLSHLRYLSADIIKIDQSFVRDMLDDPDDYAIINGVIGLAHAFNREVIAEGVETTEHGLMLLRMGCEQAQGYGIARPMPAGELSGWLDNYQANEEWILCGNEVSSKVELFAGSTSK